MKNKQRAQVFIDDLVAGGMTPNGTAENAFCDSATSPPFLPCAAVGSANHLTDATSSTLARTSNNSGTHNLTSVSECATFLMVSESWVRRYLHELPAVRVGRLVRIDSSLLLRRFQGKTTTGNRLRQGKKGGEVLQLRRYQRGYVYKASKKEKVWYGMWREDVQKVDGTVGRRQ